MQVDCRPGKTHHGGDPGLAVDPGRIHAGRLPAGSPGRCHRSGHPLPGGRIQPVPGLAHRRRGGGVPERPAGAGLPGGHPGDGEGFQFKGLALAAYHAYEVQLFRNCPEELRDLCSDLRGRTLDAGILEDIRSELPRRRDIADGWGERDLPALFPRICAGARTLPGRELVRRIKLNELFQSRDQVHAFVDQAGRRTSCLLHGTPENIAGFLAGHALADRVTLTGTSYELILSASGSVIDQCPDKALLDEVTRALLPIQRGETAPAPIFSPTMTEMALWLQSEQGQGHGRMAQMM